MRRPTRTALPMLAFLFGLTLAVGPTVAAPVVAASPMLVESAEGARVMIGGEAVALPGPADATVRAFATAKGGWAAVGERADEAGRTRFHVALGTGTAVEALPSPPLSATAPLAGSPALVHDASGLHGLAWLEGERVDGLAVRFASWEGEEWGAPLTVAEAGPGSQTGLAAVVLDDGTRLLVWSRYDGNDDEVVWSLGDADGWSYPQAVAEDNLVPDVTPALRPLPGGALLVWSRYDGNDYRLVLSRYDATTVSWSEARMDGPKGAVLPSFPDAAGAPVVLFRQAVPGGWAVAEVDEDALAFSRQGFLETPDRRRPAILRDADGIELRWGQDETGELATRIVSLETRSAPASR